MLTVYAICAVVGGVVLVCQFLITLAGLGGAHDVSGGGHDLAAGIHTGDTAAPTDTGETGESAETDHAEQQSSWFLGVLTFRSVTAATAFFGLGGLAGNYSGLPGTISFSCGLVAGAAALFVVAWIMRFFSTLQAEGTVHIEQALGAQGTVYLPIPAQRAGTGKVQVNVRERTMEYLAMTANDALPAGAHIEVVNIIGPNTVEVAPMSKTGEN